MISEGPDDCGTGGVRYTDESGSEHLVHAYTEDDYGLEDVHALFGLGRVESHSDEAVALVLTGSEIRNVKAMADAQSFDHPEGFIAMCLDIHVFASERGPGPFVFYEDP